MMCRPHPEDALTVALFQGVRKTKRKNPVHPAFHDGRNREPVHGKLQEIDKYGQRLKPI